MHARIHETEGGEAGWTRCRRYGGRVLALLAATTALSTPAAAHSGTTHAGTPHWLLFVLLVAGLAVLVGVASAARRGLVSGRVAAVSLAAGSVVAVFGAIGLVELQVVGGTPPELVAVYPVVSLVVGGLLAMGGFLVVRLKWPSRPRYALLCLVLGAWIVYPAVMPNGGYGHPLGYLVVTSLPAVLAYVLWTDARAVLQSVRLRTRPKLAGVGAGLLMSLFFAFSAGTMSFNPDQGANLPNEAFVIPYEVASPLVVWPAVEWYLPSVPFSGYVSVGTLLVMGVLGGLVGLNVAVLAQQWTGGGDVAGGQLFSGSVAASGATACCCCAPALYGVVSVLFGSAATPLYWSFMIPSSPLGGTFFAASVLLLLGSVLRATGGDATDLPGASA